jgi:RHS repeat-associated protein
MDLNTGLTQALSDGTNDYIYGVGRIAQINTGTEYFLGDALGSVRQLVNAGGVVTYSRAYDPYGVAASTGGSSQTSYGYTGEFTSNELVYLRARMYAPSMGRFLTRDTWEGDTDQPITYNKWMYANANPVIYNDPSGQSSRYVMYDRWASVAYARKYADSINPEYGQFAGSDCTNFVSQALRAGGLTEDGTWHFEAPGPNGIATRCYPWPLSSLLNNFGLQLATCGSSWVLTDKLKEYLVSNRGFSPSIITGTLPASSSEDMTSIRGKASGLVLPSPIQRDKYGAFSFSSYQIRPGDVVFYHQNHAASVANEDAYFNHSAFVIAQNMPLQIYLGVRCTRILALQ